MNPTTKGNLEMKKDLNTKITSAKKFVHTHKTKIVLVAGISAGAATALLIKKHLDDQKTSLLVTDETAHYMRNGASGHYETKYGKIYVRMDEPYSSTEE